MQASKMINEKPSKLANLGQEVLGAKRHYFDTYDNPEKAREKAQAKATKDKRKDLKTQASVTVNLCTSLDGAISALCRYEMALALEKIPGYEGNKNGSIEAIKELKEHVLKFRGQPCFDDYAKAFNRCSRACSKIRYYIRDLEAARKYLAPKKKDTFKEFNGVKGAWSLGEAAFSPSCADELSSMVRAVQFGNSLTLAEREYCLHNLLSAIRVLGGYFDFDFKALAFSFGARGKAGSIAHYQDSAKALAFNRGWIGAFIHELGHAVDYALDMPSLKKMPWSIRRAYREKLDKIKNMSRNERSYYMCEKEIFARLFEVYLRDLIPSMNDFMQVTYNEEVMPELNEESRAWMDGVLESLKVKGAV